MIKSSFKKSEPVTERIYNSQAGAVVFICAFIFKVSSLVGIIATTMQSSTLWAYFFLTLLEIICIGFLYGFFRNGTDEIPSVNKSVIYRVALFLMMIFLLLKTMIYISYAMLYLTTDLFSGIPSIILLIIFISCATYLTSKGIKSIARICELSFIICLFIIMINLIFLKTELDFGRNLPVFSMEPTQFFADVPVYGLWLGDLLPLVFIRPKNKKLPYFGMSLTICYLLILILVGIGISMYGDALPFVSSLLVRITGFNQLSLEIGRMEWTVVLVSLVMAVTQIAFILWGVEECSHRVFGSKIYVRIFYLIAIIAIGFFSPSLQVIADFGVERAVGYTATAIVVFLSLFFIFTSIRAKKVLENGSGEYVRIAPTDSKECIQSNIKEDKKIEKDKEMQIDINGDQFESMENVQCDTNESEQTILNKNISTELKENKNEI